MIRLDDHVNWDHKYGVMLIYMENFMESNKRFIKLLKAFADFESPPTTDYLGCDFSQRTLKHHSDYFGEGVRFSLTLPDSEDEVVLDFETFLVKLRIIIDIYLREQLTTEEERKEIEELFEQIKINLLA